jgi:Tol biopolymer transport system component/Cdc6-like AAA superfamily ATPase
VEQNQPILQTTEVESPPSDSDPTPEKKRCGTVTLTDEPEDKDAFSPHDKIAEAIANLIRSKNPKDAKGIAIGIEGSWGSGKSTVGRLLTKHLASNSDIAIVSFDAWAHEGDPLRRTFLETLIKKFQNLKWIDQEKWKNRRDELANRRQVVTTKDSLKITTWGYVIAFTLLLVPLGGSFIGAALRENFTFEWGPWATKVIILGSIGWILTFGPVLVFLLGFKKEPDIVNILFKGPTEKTTQTTKTTDPTSIEFEESFEMLLEEAIGKNDRQVVLILDNLDRVDAKDALSIWSTLQTFFQHKGTGRPDWHKRLWLVVLYDLGGLSQLWQKDETAGNSAAVSFIDKSFQIRFEVPRLVPSDWREFLVTQLTKAFPDHSDSDLHEVYRVLAISETQQKQLPTIRELKLFANQIGSIHRQWAGQDSAHDTFPLGHIACYVVLRRNKDDIISKLYESNFPAKDYTDLLGSTLRENLAGLAFNVETSVAQQLLYSDKIKAALVNGKEDELKDAAELLGKAFWDTFERIATTEWATTEASKMADAALTLQESGLVTTPFQPSPRSVIKAICEHAEGVEIWASMDQNKAKGLAVLLRWKMDLRGLSTQNERFVDRLFRGIAVGLSKDRIREDLKLVAKDWLENLEIITHDLDQDLRPRALRVVFNALVDELETVPLAKRQLDVAFEVLAELQERSELNATQGKNLPDIVHDGKISQITPALDDSPTAAAWVLYLLSRYDSSFEVLKKSTVPVNEAVVETFVGILERFKQTSLLFDILKVDSSFKELVVTSLGFVLNRPVARELFEGENAVERLEFVSRELDNNQEQHETLKRLFSQLPRDLNLERSLTRKVFEPAVANLYLLILETGGEGKPFAGWCFTGLRAVNSDTWREHLGASDRLLKLASYLNKSIELNLGEQYFQGLVTALEIGIEVAWPSPPVEYGNLARLIGPLESPFRYAFQDQVRALIKDSSKLRPWFYMLVGPELLAQLNSTRGLQVIEVFELILDRNEAAGLVWLNQTLSGVGTSLEQKYSDKPVWAKLQQAARRALIAQPVSSETHSIATSIANFLHVKPFNNGTVVFAASNGSRIVALPPGTSEEVTLIQHPFPEFDSVSQPTWSPDGKRVAFIGSTAFKLAEIFVLTEASGEFRQLTSGSTSSRQPSWAPNGKGLAFTRLNGQKSNIFTIDLETSQETRLTNLEKAEHPSWSPDGRRIVFQTRGGDGSTKIALMNADGSDLSYRHDGSDPSWSPGGDLIAFVLRRDDARALCVFNPKDDSTLKVIEKGDVYNPEWSPDGTKLLYQVGTDSNARIFQIDIDGQNKKELGRGVYPSWQPVLSDGPEHGKPKPITPST